MQLIPTATDANVEFNVSWDGVQTFSHFLLHIMATDAEGEGGMGGWWGQNIEKKKACQKSSFTFTTY
jgi:hypothetical protein